MYWTVRRARYNSNARSTGFVFKHFVRQQQQSNDGMTTNNDTGKSNKSDGPMRREREVRETHERPERGERGERERRDPQLISRWFSSYHGHTSSRHFLH